MAVQRQPYPQLGPAGSSLPVPSPAQPLSLCADGVVQALRYPVQQGAHPDQILDMLLVEPVLTQFAESEFQEFRGFESAAVGSAALDTASHFHSGEGISDSMWRSTPTGSNI